MSTPRVGSSSTSTGGAQTTAAAMATFCWLPPESERIGVSSAGGLDLEPVAQVAAAMALHPAAAQHADGRR